MKYLFINSVAGSGSTGRIAADQCRKLQKSGHECVLAYGRVKANCDDINTYQIGTKLDYILHGIESRILDNQGFCSKTATKKFLKWVDGYNPDVIWLHNIHGYYMNIELLFDYLKQANKKVYWTLHDCWSFTGHCSHFTYANCYKWRGGCCHCVQKGRYPKSLVFDNSKRNYQRKKEAFCGVKDMTLITPSQWMADLIKDSFLKAYPIDVVRNTIDENIFKPTAGNFRRQYGLEDKKILLGVASIWEERKGLKDYLKLAEMLDEDYRIVLVGLNKKQIKKMPENILGLERTESVRQLAEIYTAADLFVNLSYEESFGMTIMEAQACGTPVIAYDAGGTREAIRIVEPNNKIVKAGDLTAILKCILRD